MFNFFKKKNKTNNTFKKQDKTTYQMSDSEFFNIETTGYKEEIMSEIDFLFAEMSEITKNRIETKMFDKFGESTLENVLLKEQYMKKLYAEQEVVDNEVRKLIKELLNQSPILYKAQESPEEQMIIAARTIYDLKKEPSASIVKTLRRNIEKREVEFNNKYLFIKKSDLK